MPGRQSNERRKLARCQEHVLSSNSHRRTIPAWTEVIKHTAKCCQELVYDGCYIEWSIFFQDSNSYNYERSTIRHVTNNLESARELGSFRK